MNRLLLAALVLATAGAPRPGTAAPQTCVWTGHGGNALWSTDGNWTCLAVSPHGHPQNGDDVGFPDNSQQPVNTNDLSQLVVHHLILDQPELLVTGNPISLSSGLEGNPSGLNGSDGPYFDLAIKLTANGEKFENTGGAFMQFDGPLDLNNHDLTITGTTAFILNGDIGGFGSITKTGNADAYLQGNNTYAGTTTISNGVLVVDGAGLGAAGAGNETFVNSGGTLFLTATGKSIAETLSLNDYGYSGLGALATGGFDNVITSGMDIFGQAAINVLGTAATTLTITAPVSGGTLIKIGDGTLRLDASAPFVEVDAGVLELNGADSGTIIRSGATLAGIGTAFGTTELSDGSFASPGTRSGNGAGTLAVQDVNWSAGAQLRFQLGRSTALSDQMIVSGNLTHNGIGSYVFAFSDASTPPLPGVTYTLITFASNQGFAESDFSFAYAGMPAPGQGTGMVGAFKLTSTQVQFTPSVVVSDLLFRDGFD